MRSLKYIIYFIVMAISYIPVDSDIDSTEYLVKAAFFEKLARYIIWPDENSKSTKDPFVIGVYIDNPFGHILEDLYKNRKIKNRKVKIRYIKQIGVIESVDILFVPATQSDNLSEAVNSLRRENTLIVSEYPGMARKGSHINFFINERSNVNFELNLNLLKKDKFNVNIALIEVAKIIR